METLKGSSLAPIFIIGVPRSGTTLLRVLLDSHSKIAAAPETPWILGGYGKTSIREIAGYLTADQLGPVRNLPGEDEQIVLEGIRAMLDRIFTAYLQKKGKEVLVLKTPDDIRYIEFLLKLYPHSKYLHIYRDGRDVACSTVGKKGSFFGQMLTDYGELNHENAMRRWYDWEKKVRGVFDGSGGFSYVRMSYEALVTQPAETLMKVCEGIGVPYEKGMLDYAKSEHEYPEWEAGSTDVKKKERIDTSSLGRWKNEIPSKELVRLEAKYGDLLEELGYTLGSDAQERAMAAKEETALRELQRALQQKDELLKQKESQLDEEVERVRNLEEQIKDLEAKFSRKCEQLAEIASRNHKLETEKHEDLYQFIEQNKELIEQKDSRLQFKRDLLKQNEELRKRLADKLNLKDEKIKVMDEQLRRDYDRITQLETQAKEKEEQLRMMSEERSGEKQRFEEESRIKSAELKGAQEALRVRTAELAARDQELVTFREERAAERQRFEEESRIKSAELKGAQEALRVRTAELAARDQELATLREERAAERQRLEERLRRRSDELKEAQGALVAGTAALSAKEQELVTLREGSASDRQRLEEKLRFMSDELKEAQDALRAGASDRQRLEEKLSFVSDELKEAQDALRAGASDRQRLEEKLRFMSDELKEAQETLSARASALSAREQELVTLRKESAAEKLKLEEANRQKDKFIADLLSSKSWKITSPLRAIYGLMKKDKTG